ncbi:MAG: ribonucleoside reductase [Proteobacteria bacterium]|nr:ribonucleoside reductase [Pseudomonadota bacterium]
MSEPAHISRQIWDMKYRLKGADGHPVDKTMADSFRRVATALAEPENDKALWRDRFAEAMDDFKFLPAGRILAGAGSERRVTLFNCFVMGDIPDDMSGIFEHLKEAALTMQQGGGIGYDFSSLRPKGAPVHRVGADASGPLSFMDVWDAMCRTIMSAGSRRGAMMGVLRCDHPDIEAFIEAKREPGRLRMFNLSVLITDAFMQAVQEDAAWELKFDGVAYRSLPARELWDAIMRATYAYAEPGVIFIDRINAKNNLHYCETIHATNPCVTADTWVHTSEGPRQVSDLLGRSFTALVNGQAQASGDSGFFETGLKPVLRLRTREGYALRLTPDHRVRRVSAKTRWRMETEWVAAETLRPGDEIILHDHRAGTDWPGLYDQDEGYLIGLLIGDGTLKADKAVLSVWPGAIAVNGGYERPGVNAVMDRAVSAAKTLPHRSDFRGWMEVPGRGEYRMSLAALRHLVTELGARPGAKTITPAMESASAQFCRGLLSGLFDADGSVQGTQAKGISIRLAQSDAALLEAAQRILLRLGIVSSLYRDRRPAQMRLMPDGRGGMKEYPCAANHELIVSGENVIRFKDSIGFTDTDKSARLSNLCAAYKRAPNRERFVARVETLSADGVEPVYDTQIPGINAFDANGLYVHNCGEQPLPPYGACLLGSVNLAKLVEKPFADDARLDVAKLETLVATAVRMMDNAIDVSKFPLPEQLNEAKAKRRIGLGVTGLADALIMTGARYGGSKAVALTENWMRTIQRAAYMASVELAREKGAFPLFDKEQFLAGETIAGLDLDVQGAIAEHGIRNALLTSIAPTGTISLLADNVSSGLEPVFSFKYSRHVMMPDGSRREENVTDYAYRLYRSMFGDDATLTDAFVDAQGLSPNDHLVMQAAVQKYIDSSISKTINCPEAIPFDSFKDIYSQAFDLGCKGCTTYRPNDITGAVLEVKGDSRQSEPELPLESPVISRTPKDLGDSGPVTHLFEPLDRPGDLEGKTYKLRWPESDHAIYITMNDILDDQGRIRPFEIFINSKNTEHYAWTVALTRMISAVFRRGGDVSFVIEELKAVFDPRGGQWMGGRYVPSLLAAIGGVIEQHMTATGFLKGPGEIAAFDEAKQLKVAALGGGGGGGGGGTGGTGGGPAGIFADGKATNAIPFRQCPKCGQASLVREEGCDNCKSCSYSKCG